MTTINYQTATREELALPLVHSNGDTLETLIDDRRNVCHAARELLRTLGEMTPNGRNYYHVPGLLKEAQDIHRQRTLAVQQIMDDILAEAIALQDKYDA